MANKNIDMSKLRQIIKIYCQKQGSRTIRDTTGISRCTVQKYITQFQGLRVPWDELSKLSDQELEALFHPDPVTPDPPERQKELHYIGNNSGERLIINHYD